MRALRVVGKVLGWMVLGVVVLVVLALATVFIGVRTERGSRFLLDTALGFADKYLAAKITVGRLRTNLLSDLVLEDVEMRDIEGELAARIDKLTVRFSLVPLFKQTLRIAKVDIEGGRGRVRFLKDGQVNFAALHRPSQPQPPRPDSPASKFRVEIGDVHARLFGRFEPTKEMGIPAIEGDIGVTGEVGIGGGDVTVKVQSLLVALIQPAPALVTAYGGLVVTGGSVRFDPTKVSVDAPGSALRPFVASPRLKGRYHFDIDGKGPLEKLVLEVVASTPSRPIRVEGELKLLDGFAWSGHVLTRGLDPQLILDGVPHASLWLDAKGKGDTKTVQFAVAHAQIEAEKNRIHASGKAGMDPGMNAQLELEIDAKDLSKLKGVGVPKLGGTVKGRAKLRYAGNTVKLDSDLVARELSVPGVRVAELHLVANTENLGGHAKVDLRDLKAGTLGLTQARLQLDGDRKTFFVRASAAGNDGTSLEVGLQGTPRYEDSPIPVGISAVLTSLDVTRNRETWHVESGAKLAIGPNLRVEHLRARSEHQALDLDGSYDLARGEIDARVNATDLDVHRIVALIAPAGRTPHSKLTLSAKAKGPIAHPRAELAMTGTITRDAAKPDDRLKLAIDGKIDERNITVKANGETPAGSFAIDAAVPFARSLTALLSSAAPGSARIDLKIASLARLYSTLGLLPPPQLSALEGRVALSAALTGSARRPKLELHLDGDDLRYATLKHATFRSRIDLTREHGRAELDLSLGEHGEKKLPAGRLTAHFDTPLDLRRLMNGGSLVERLGPNTIVDAGLKTAGIALTALPLGMFGIPTVEAGTLDADVSLGGTYRASKLQAKVTAKGLKRDKLEGIDVEIGADATRREAHVQAKVAMQTSPLVVLDGKLGLDVSSVLESGVSLATPFSVKATFPGFDLQKLASMLPGITGKLTGEATGQGTLGAPVASARLGVAGFAMAGERLDQLAISGSYAKDRIEAELKAHEPAGGRLTGKALVQGGNLTAMFEAHAFALALELEGEELQLRRLRGVLDADVRATGPLASPALTGRLALSKGTLAIVADPREITKLELRVAIDPQEFRIETLTGKLGSGRFDVTGGAKLAGLVPATVDLVVKTIELPAMQVPLSVGVTSKITIHGEKQGRVLKGTVLVEDGAARLPTLTNVRNLQSTGALKDVVFVDAKGLAATARKLAEPPADALEIEIDTKIPGPFHVRSKEVQVDLEGALTLKVKGADVRLRGSVEASPGGRLELFGKRYDINHIRVTFNGRKNINPTLNVKITRELTSARIGAEVTGTAKRPVLRLFSEPPIYADTQIITAMLGGDPGDPARDRSLDKQVTGAIAGLVIGVIKDQLAPQLPIDVIKVETGDGSYGGVTSTRVEIGKYITESIYVSYVHQFGQTQIGTRRISANQGDFEYRFLKRFSLDLSIGDAPAGRADLFWTLRF